MQMVGSAGSTMRTVIEHHQFWIVLQQTVYLYIMIHDPLGLMLLMRNSEMFRQDGERVD